MSDTSKFSEADRRRLWDVDAKLLIERLAQYEDEHPQGSICLNAAHNAAQDALHAHAHPPTRTKVEQRAHAPRTPRIDQPSEQAVFGDELDDAGDRMTVPERERCGMTWGGSPCVRFANHTGRHQTVHGAVTVQHERSPLTQPSQAYIDLATTLLSHPDVVHAMAVRLSEEGL